jgi:hypothetical protein
MKDPSRTQPVSNFFEFTITINFTGLGISAS